MMRLSLFALLALATPALADRISASVDCHPAETELLYGCTIALTEGGAPVEAASFTVTPSMPSMPMAHNVPPAPAAATDTPGTYAVDLHLEMAGDWLLTLDITAPRRDRITLRHGFGAEMPHAEGGMEAGGHGDHAPARN